MIHLTPVTLEGHGVRLEPLGLEHADAIVAAAQRFFAISEPLVIRSIALFTEAEPGADFMLHRHFRFGG